ncbi:MAG: PKD domain-containing protein, partial [Candidatus Vogelbacteria bacterium]|nr:PKD domain-containing protein [Candidatus Vogelbacteria bacterium]
MNFSATNDTKGDWSNASFTWSFGDGAIASGKNVSHPYQFAGNYNVVLNAKAGDGLSAVSRTAITVEEPELKISEVNPKLGFIEIENSSKSEKNINGWILKNASSTYSFPTDTIISKQAKIKFSVKTLGFGLMAGDMVQLLASDGSEFGRLSLAVNNSAKLKELRQKLNLLKQKINDSNAVGAGDVEKIVAETEIPNQGLAEAVSLPEQQAEKIPEVALIEQLKP